MLRSVCALLLLFSRLAVAGIEDKYRQLKTIPVGPLLITEPHVTIVGPQAIGAGKERVTLLHLDHGIVHIQAHGSAGPEMIDAEIGQGNDRDPAANFSGTFEWQNGSLTSFTLDKLHLRLRRAKSTVTLFQGILQLDPNSDLFIDNIGTVSFQNGVTTGGITLAMFGSQLVEPVLTLQGTPVKATLSSSAAKQNIIAVDLALASFTAQDATYTAKTAAGTEPIKPTVFFHDTITDGRLSLEGIQLALGPGVPHIAIATSRISEPKIHVSGYENVPVIEAQQYVATKVSSDSSKADELRFDALQASESLATANPWGVINQLNTLNAFSTDVLLPTGNPDLRYIRPADLGQLYEVFARAAPSDKKVTGVLIQQTNGVVTKVVVDYGPAPSVNDSIGHQQNPVCFLVETLTGAAAGAAVDALFAEVPLYTATNVWLRVTNPLNPRFAVPSFVTTFAVSKGAVKLFGEGFNYKGLGFDGIAAAVAGGLADEYCEVLVAKIPNRVVFSRPNYLVKPYLFETIQFSPEALYSDQLGTKYQLYLGRAVNVDQILHDPAVSIVARGSQQQSATLKTLSDSNASIDAKSYQELSSQIKAAQERDETSASQRGMPEATNIATSQSTQQANAAQIAEDKRRKEEQDRVSKDDPNQHVPGLPPQPTPPPSTVTKKDENCPTEEPCPVITIRVPRDKQ